MIRLFLALPAPPTIQESALRLTASLRDSTDVRWVRPELLHLTLKFLGSTPEDRLEGIAAAAAEMANTFSRFVIYSGRVGAFPNLRKPQTIWLGLDEEEDGTLARLARGLDAALVKDGFAAEERPFRPHLTLGRVKSRRNNPQLGRDLERLAGLDPERIPWLVEAIHLIQSDLRPSGPDYTTLRVFPLRAEE